MTTTTTTVASNLYPFLTKNQIKNKIANDTEFAHECLLIIHARQTEDEKETKDTKWKNRRGFMSSHAVRGTTLANKLLAGEWLNPDEETMLTGIVGSYTKQLAAHFRQAALADRPELAEQAKVFGL